MNLRIDKPGSPKKIYPAVGTCIYCGKSTDKLGSEHIVPQGLGGAVELLAASCRRCERITSGIESHCISEWFNPARLHMGVPTKAGARRRPTLRARVTYENHSKIVKAQIPDYPLILALPAWEPPTVLLGFPEPNHGTLKARLVGYRDTKWRERLSRLGARQFSHRSKLHLDLFVRFLAKVGHSYAAAEIGLDAFDAALPPIIDGSNGNPTVAHWIGSDKISEAPSLALHEVDLYRQRVETFFNGLFRVEEYWVARIRLFAKLGMPTYYVVVGRSR